MTPDKLKINDTTDGQPARPGYENAATPAPVKSSGQHEAYWILSESERAKGFVRPLRFAYTHIGVRPLYPLRDLTPEEATQYKDQPYVKFEDYPHPHIVGEARLMREYEHTGRRCTGRFWTPSQLESGCRKITGMSQSIAETYARDPKFYTSTFCCHCGKHFPVGEKGEFVWEGTTERVGT